MDHGFYIVKKSLPTHSRCSFVFYLKSFTVLSFTYRSTKQFAWIFT